MLNNQRVRVTGMAQNEFPRNFWDEIRPLGAHKCRHGAQKIFTKCFGNPWLFPMCIYIYIIIHVNLLGNTHGCKFLEVKHQKACQAKAGRTGTWI